MARNSCTHVIGVLQAEVIAQRSFAMFADCLSLLPESSRPRVLGVFLNMLQLRQQTSIDVLVRACEKLPKDWLFETSIPRNAAFLEAAAAGVPLHLFQDFSQEHENCVNSRGVATLEELGSEQSKQPRKLEAGSFHPLPANCACKVRPNLGALDAMWRA